MRNGLQSGLLLRGALLTGLAMVSFSGWSQEPDASAENETITESDLMPDIRDSQSRLALVKESLVVVPIPMSNPTLDTGLVLAGAWFWPQTEEQKASQPASVTGAAAFYTSNESFGYGAAHKQYWNEDRWRFEGIIGHVDLKLELRLPIDLDQEPRIGWFLKGNFLQLDLLRKIRGDWYGGLFGRYFSLEQDFAIEFPAIESTFGSEIDAVGLGFKIEYDSRDMPFNSFSGGHFELDALFNSESLGSDQDYQWAKALYSSYHRVHEQVILAWELKGCAISDGAPLWDLCRVTLRGFPVTDYLGDVTASGQVEARWQFHPKWGAVAFAGAGAVIEPYSDLLDDESVPSYGVGIRFMILKEHRINVRLDYARSKDSDAVYLAVGEEF